MIGCTKRSWVPCYVRTCHYLDHYLDCDSLHPVMTFLFHRYTYDVVIDICYTKRIGK